MHDKPGGRSITAKQKDTLANYKPGEKRKRLNTNNGAALGGVILWPDNELELLLNTTLEHKVNITPEKCLLKPLVLSVVGE